MLKMSGTQSWIPIVTTICTSICVLVGLIYVWILVYCVRENKMIDKYLNSDDYEGLITYASKKEKRPFFLLAERKHYYSYLIMLARLGLNDIDGIEQSFETFEKYEDFPISLYWKASYEISINKLDNIEEYYNKFINSGDIRKKAYELRNIVYLFEAYKHYANNDLDKVNESINQIDVDRISIPCSKKSISILKEAIANNKKETVEEEVKEIENNEENIDIE
jgi:hypothetical protein